MQIAILVFVTQAIYSDTKYIANEVDVHLLLNPDKVHDIRFQFTAIRFALIEASLLTEDCIVFPTCMHAEWCLSC